MGDCVLYVVQRVFCVGNGVFRVSVKVCWYECFVCWSEGVLCQ